MVVHAYNLHIWEVGDGELDVQSHPQLHSELEAKLEYISSYLKQRIKSYWKYNQETFNKIMLTLGDVCYFLFE